jgi:hypothetical protein
LRFAYDQALHLSVRPDGAAEACNHERGRAGRGTLMSWIEGAGGEYWLAYSSLRSAARPTCSPAKTSGDAGVDAVGDTSTDVVAHDVVTMPFDAGGKDAQLTCVNGGFACNGSAPCCTNPSSPNYGKCEPTGQCL